MIRILAMLALVVAGVIGWTFTARFYRLNEVGAPADQQVLAHRDSAYTAISWVATPGSNTLQLRFFDRVEGGVCLQPTWTDLINLAATVPNLRHLIPSSRPPTAAVEPGWPAGWPLPDPGTVNSSPYISLFPAGLLLNQRLMAAAGGALHQAKPKILIVGLGSGVGSAQIFHHCPNADITVVDIDQAVIDMVRSHYPLLNWMEQQGKLHLVTADARSFMRYEAKPGSFDLIILDAYTAGSTIPPHLMTREFFAQCGEAVHDDGIVFANIIGSYASENAGTLVGQQHKVLGGALRSMHAAQRQDGTPLLPYGWVFPIFQSYQSPRDFENQRSQSRNNIVVMGRRPLDPKGNAQGWERLSAHHPLGELPTGRWVSTAYCLINDNAFSSSKLPERFVSADVIAMGKDFTAVAAGDAPAYELRYQSANQAFITALKQAVAAKVGSDGLAANPKGWDQPASMVFRFDTDWVQLPREVWRVAVGFARGADNDVEALVGPRDGDPARNDPTATWTLRDAPLFTDQSPNADIWNR